MELIITKPFMTIGTSQPAPAGVSPFSLSLNTNYWPVHLSVINITRKKGFQRCSHQRRKGRSLARSALVEANAPSVPSLPDRTGRSSSSQTEIIQSTAVSKSSWNRADDMQAEARAMTRAASASVYSPEMLVTKYGSRPIRVLGRTWDILVGLGSFAFTLWLDQRNGQLNQNKRLRATQLRKVFTGLGPTFVKIGQGLSTRPDICPPEYLEELAELQDALPTFPNAEAFICIEKELGFPLEDIYSYISPNPIAAASLGQVYKAQLKYSGQTVAVKVQRPGIEESIGLDFYLIRGLASFINKYVDIVTSDVVALVDEFARRVYQELNYVQVCAGREECKKI